MTKVILPVHNTIIDTFNIYGSITSIISNNEKCFTWIYNNFIQLRYVYDWNTVFFDNHHLLMDNCPWLNHHVIPKFIVQQKWNCLTQFIKESLDNGSYVYLYIDRFHLSASKSNFKKKSNLHEIFIYGYNNESEEFFIADNLAYGKYIRAVCTFEEIEKGYAAINSEKFPYISSDNPFFHNIHLFNLKEEKEYNINIPQIAESIKNYLDSAPSIDLSFKEKTLFGQESIYFSVNRFEDQKPEPLDIRAFHLFWEHKKLMVDRINYLIKENYLSDCNYFVENYKSICDSFEYIRNMALKYNITQDLKLFYKIQLRVRDVLKEEMSVLNEVRDNLVV
ncbi:hypothetical protein [Paenibacillus xylanexedens]|uniref:hypothetical protein n=1 Tax=Paenibacillus xylanexedens TaxID=528191 RepID=UPI003B026B86